MGVRRLTAILAADIAGYSAMMGANEIDTVAALKSHQSVILPMIAGFDGRVIDTAGDGVVAEFASVLNAVKCAVAIQETMRERNASVAPDRRMQFRIGINQGDVLFDDDRIYGDGINVAARLEGICEPGGICISGKVYDEIKGRLEILYRDIGVQHLKNISEPVRTYRISVSGVPASKASQGAKFQLLGTRNRLIAAGAITAIFLVGTGWWTLTSVRINQSQTARPSAVQTATPGGPAVASTRSATSVTTFEFHAFDGVWEFRVIGGQYCPVKSFSFLRRFQGGEITSSDGQKVGNITNDGSFRFSNPSPLNANIVVESQGKLTGDTGQGTFNDVGTPCVGTYQIHLVKKL